MSGFNVQGLGKSRVNDPLLRGSWDLVSRVTSTLIGVISNYNCSYLA